MELINFTASIIILSFSVITAISFAIRKIYLYGRKKQREEDLSFDESDSDFTFRMNIEEQLDQINKKLNKIKK